MEIDKEGVKLASGLIIGTWLVLLGSFIGARSVNPPGYNDNLFYGLTAILAVIGIIQLIRTMAK